MCWDSWGACWSFGDNTCGQLGLNHWLPKFSPARVCLDSSGQATDDDAYARQHFSSNGGPSVGSRGHAGREIATSVANVACGGHHTLFLTSSGHVFATGSNSCGQLGLEGLDTDETARPALVPALQPERVCAVSAGRLHSAAACGAYGYMHWMMPRSEKCCCDVGWLACGR